MGKKQLRRMDLIFANDEDFRDILEQTLARPNEEIVEDMISSGLKGRGGAGFPTGLKWKLTAEEKAIPPRRISFQDRKPCAPG